MTSSFEKTYPNIADWVKYQGWIEIGHDDFSKSFVRALDIGGMVWQGGSDYETVDGALQELETELAKWKKGSL